MKIYNKAPIYDIRTGKLKGEEMVADHICCDFTGALVDIGDAPTIYIDYHYVDPCFGSDGAEYDFGKKYKLDMHEFLSQPYDFANWTVYEMFLSMLVQHKNDETFDIALRNMRMKTAQGMIERGQIEPWELSPKKHGE